MLFDLLRAFILYVHKVSCAILTTTAHSLFTQVCPLPYTSAGNNTTTHCTFLCVCPELLSLADSNS